MPNNLFGDIPAQLPEELLQTLFSGEKGFRVERIVSRGHSSPDGFWYEQDEENRMKKNGCCCCPARPNWNARTRPSVSG
ncbi:hypothetical protein [Chromobacterium haemolyticum]|uniref:hypothetical protein n=1 Tax=Chromobacterium haemolyticum TaxID=394935 RepID=UPI0020CB0926|nr:hypothetical protein [Chromobacterium haemolyticum]